MVALAYTTQSPFNRDDLWGFVTMQLSIYIPMLDVPAPGRITCILENVYKVLSESIPGTLLLFAISMVNNRK